MVGGFRRPRILIIAIIIVVLSISIVFAALPLLQHPVGPHGTLRTPMTQTLGPGDSNNPGHTQLLLPSLTTNESFVFAVSLTSGNATFCVLNKANYLTWAPSNFAPSSLPSGSCIVYETTASDTISFVPPSAGDWYIVGLNTTQQTLTVTFSPA